MLKIIARTLSLRLSLMVVCAIAVLLTAALVVMFHFSRQALREEAMRDAEHTLEGTALHIDNILLSVEQTAGNYYWDLMRHIDQPERLETFCRELVKSNHYVVGCAVAFKPYYFPGRENCMTYVRQNADTLQTLDAFRSQPYTEQEWYTQPLETGRACWMEPLLGEQPDEALISFCLPIYDRTMQTVGTMGVDIPLSRLSDFILAAKPSPNGYSTLLGRGGTFIVHPDSVKLLHQTVFTQTEQGAHPSVREAAEAMISGKSGFKPFILNGEQWYVIFKPFQRAEVPGRSMENLDWSVGVVYPDKDIFREYNQLLYYLLAIAVVGLLLIFLLCRLFTHRQLLPLTMLTDSARRIADGHYEETIPDTNREDEIGQLQDHFQQMQQSLAVHVGEQETLSATLQERGRELRKAYSQAQEADKMKTSFLHYMTNQMMEPSDAIDKGVTTLCNSYGTASPQEIGLVMENIQQQSDAILKVLDHMLQASDRETTTEMVESGKEVVHE